MSNLRKEYKLAWGKMCDLERAPLGWWCSRALGHEGSCAARRLPLKQRVNQRVLYWLRVR